MIAEATEKDIAELTRLIAEEFSYTKFNAEKLSQRMKKPGIFVFKKTENKKLIGFIEFEIIGPVAMLNALSVKKEFRKQGHGKELLDFAIQFLEEIPVKKINLLVKKNNQIAKKLYKSAGFSFEKMHGKKIDNTEIEIWSAHIENDEYLN